MSEADVHHVLYDFDRIGPYRHYLHTQIMGGKVCQNTRWQAVSSPVI